jgi:hypothetical protein
MKQVGKDELRALPCAASTGGNFQFLPSEIITESLYCAVEDMLDDVVV